MLRCISSTLKTNNTQFYTVFKLILCTYLRFDADSHRYSLQNVFETAPRDVGRIQHDALQARIRLADVAASVDWAGYVRTQIVKTQVGEFQSRHDVQYFEYLKPYEWFSVKRPVIDRWIRGSHDSGPLRRPAESFRFFHGVTQIEQTRTD